MFLVMMKIDDGVVVIELNNFLVNVLVVLVFEGFECVVKDVQVNLNVCVIVIYGVGGKFSGGFDIM